MKNWPWPGKPWRPWTCDVKHRSIFDDLTCAQHLDHFNNGEKSPLSRSIMKKENWMIDVTEKRHILDLDCSLGPTDSHMTSSFCKKTS
jgi:hypothetical protein